MSVALSLVTICLSLAAVTFSSMHTTMAMVRAVVPMGTRERLSGRLRGRRRLSGRLRARLGRFLVQR